jgi:hypothetical protein
MMQLVEESSGIGELLLNGVSLCQAPYRLRRYQGMNDNSGLPIPGLHRIEGSIDFDANATRRDWIGIPLNLKLEDGRTLGIYLVDAEGRILSEGHGPSKCLCC